MNVDSDFDTVYNSESSVPLPLFINSARSTKGTTAMLTMVIVTCIDTGSYGALKSGRNGIGKRTAIHRPMTMESTFHLLRIL